MIFSSSWLSERGPLAGELPADPERRLDVWAPASSQGWPGDGKHYVLAEKGRFRTSLLTTLRRFLCDEFDRSTAAKRGSGIRFVPLDAHDAETQFAEVAGASQSPEATFDRAWAETVVQSSIESLRADYQAEGQRALFDAIKRHLSKPAHRAAYTATGQRLGLSADAVAMAVVRLRRRYRAMVRAEVANT